jgi:endonuclease YncB( thermonuclease family)
VSARALVAGVTLAAVLVLTGCEPPADGGVGRDRSTSQPRTGKTTRPAKPPARVVSGVRVTRVVDGDTIRTTAGTVRFIGIDTPERGECGFSQATAYLRALVGDGAVTLTAVRGRDDRDRYGRLLRYVGAGGRDLGLALIQTGYGRARYDSRDGYGSHPRQIQYVKADAATPPKGCSR